MLLMFRCNPDPTGDNRTERHLEAAAQPPGSAYRDGHRHCARNLILLEHNPDGTATPLLLPEGVWPDAMVAPDNRVIVLSCLPLHTVVPRLSVQVQTRAQRHSRALLAARLEKVTALGWAQCPPLHSREGSGCCCNPLPVL